MELRNILTVALVAILLTPAAAAYGPTDSAPAQGESSDLPETATAGSDDSTPDDDGNYTRLYIEDGYRYTDVKPGETATFNITVGNGEDHAVELNPHVVLPKVEGRPIKEAWISIENADTTLEADEEQEFTVTVSVPSEVELGDYRAQIAFTNQTISYRGQPPQPVHAATINVEVYEKPSVEIRGDRYHYSQIQAGNSYTYEIEVENTGDEAVPLNPEIETRDSRRYGGDDNTVQRSWFEIESPNEVAPGETVTVEVTVTVPDDASVGDYDAEINLGLKDPNRPERDDHWQRLSLNFQVWQQPEEPYETSFQVSEQADNVTLTLSAGQYRQAASDEPVSFDVTFVAPNGTAVDHQRVEVSNGGHVSLGESHRRGESQGPYTSGGEGKEFVYRVDDPDAGQWTVKIMPHHTTDFRYDIVRNES